jgi:hypothetical protein
MRSDSSPHQISSNVDHVRSCGAHALLLRTPPACSACRVGTVPAHEAEAAWAGAQSHAVLLCGVRLNRTQHLRDGGGFTMDVGPFCHFATRNGVSAVFSGEVSSWPGVDLVSLSHDGVAHCAPVLAPPVLYCCPATALRHRCKRGWQGSLKVCNATTCRHLQRPKFYDYSTVSARASASWRSLRDTP